ncbi:MULTISPECIES: DUF4194 domain-containing protein [Micromonospora]|nr:MULTISPECIES: DUF4194 domain-containing protein [Micromonospora]TWJ21078.1 uncharacterized protein DUF4194 [Micromonospora endolithica]
MTPPDSQDEPSLSVAVTQLMKGVVYRDTHTAAWHHLSVLQPHVRDHVAVLGLVVVVDESEGYAYLKSRPEDPDLPPVPRLVPRRSLSFHVSLLLALLRRKLAEADASGSDPRLVLSRRQIIDMLTVFMPSGADDARLVDQIDAHLTKVIELGFLRRTKDKEPSFEVRRIVKAFVDAQWLADFDARLSEYAAELSPDAEGAA